MSTTDGAAGPGLDATLEPALGVVAGATDAGLTLHGEPLAAPARRALAAAGVLVLGPETPWDDVRSRGVPLVLHDVACPLTPPGFLAAAVAAARALAEAPVLVVGCRPVVDTIKQVADGVVGETVDRESLVGVTSPVVVTAAAVAALAGWPDTTDLPGWLNDQRGRFAVRWLDAPSIGRRVVDPGTVRMLEAYEELHPEAG